MATNFRRDVVSLLHFYIIVAHLSRARTLISSLYFDKSRDKPVLLQADGELTAHFFSARGRLLAKGFSLFAGRLEFFTRLNPRVRRVTCACDAG